MYFTYSYMIFSNIDANYHPCNLRYNYVTLYDSATEKKRHVLIRDEKRQSKRYRRSKGTSVPDASKLPLGFGLVLANGHPLLGLHPLQPPKLLMSTNLEFQRMASWSCMKNLSNEGNMQEPHDRQNLSMSCKGRTATKSADPRLKAEN